MYKLFFILDLDEKIQKEGFDKVLREDLFKQNSKPSLNPEPRIFSSGQSCSIRRIQRPDGVSVYIL